MTSTNPGHNPACKNAVVFKNLTVEANGVRLLENVTARIPHAGCTAIVGPNGAGKTTLILALLNEISYAGEITFCSGGRPRIGYVPQQLAFDRGMPLTVLEFMSGFIQKKPLCFGLDKKIQPKLLALLDEAGCVHLKNRALGALSGGELQRVMLAGALAQDPQLLILDEPASGIDFKGGEVCCELLERFQKELGFTRVMVSHDMATVMAHATHVICLNRSVRAEGSPAEILTDKILESTFGLHHGVVDIKKVHTCSCGGHHCGKDERS